MNLILPKVLRRYCVTGILKVYGFNINMILDNLHLLCTIVVEKLLGNKVSTSELKTRSCLLEQTTLCTDELRMHRKSWHNRATGLEDEPQKKTS